MSIQKSGKCIALFLICCSMLLFFSGSDLGLIRRTLYLFSAPACTFINETSIILETVKTTTNCKDNVARFTFKRRGDYWIAYNYVISTKRFKCQDSVTYVTHSDFTFLDNLIPLVKRWRGPVSIAVHAPGSDFNSTLETIFYLRSCTPLIKKYVNFHLYFPDEHFPDQFLSHKTAMRGKYDCSLNAPYENVNSTETYKQRNNLTYPVNLGRNVARSMAETYFVLTSDIELYPSLNLIPRFLRMIAECDVNIYKYQPSVFALHVFEVQTGMEVPKNKSQLKALLDKQLAVPFHEDICPQCHTIPKTVEWTKKEEDENMRVFHITKRKGRYYHWEPFYIGTKDDPEFNERLSWEGMSDKIVQAYEMCLMDYSFLILDNAFLVHRPGIKVADPEEKKWRQSYVNQTMNLIKNVLVPKLHKKYTRRYECEY